MSEEKKITDFDRIKKLCDTGYLNIISKAYDRCHHAGAFIRHVMLTMSHMRIADVREGVRKALSALEF